jgi:hypothetical protein
VTKSAFDLPVQPYPMIFGISVRDVSYGFRTQYRETPEGGWLMDLMDGNALPLARGIPLVSGLDLMYQFNHLNLGFALVTLCLDGRTTPTYESLGIEDRLVLVIEI